MGWRFRKSINCGLGFRINLSDSGIGWSWGAPGYRVTHKANGGVRKTYSFPGTGLSYIEENSVKNKNKQRTNSMERYNLENKSFTPVVNGKIDSISSPENKVFVDSLNSILKKNFITWLIGGILLLIIFILGGNLHMPSWANLLLFYGSLTLFFAICIPLT